MAAAVSAVYSDRSLLPFSSAAAPSSILSCPRLIITNQYALSLLSSSCAYLTCSALLLPSSPPPSSRRRPPMAPKSSITSTLEEGDQAAAVEQLWQRFFWDPSQWWDKRFEKGNPEAPDFEHKNTKKALWINDRFSPSWLQEKLATLTQRPPQQLSSSSSTIECRGDVENFVHTCQASRTKQFWEEFFSDPSEWWDNRSLDKRNPRVPDFKHKFAKKALWIESRFNPTWVHARLAAMVQCQEQGQSGFSTPEISGRVGKMEQLWLEFFSDPSEWWDNRFIKKSSKYPDFRHKSTHEGLWIENWLNPPWVKAKMAAMALGQIQSGGGLRSRAPNSFGDANNVSKLCREGRMKEALDMMELVVNQNTQAPIKAYASLLKGFGRRKALTEGKRVHALIVKSELDSDTFLGNTLVDMYARCGNVLNARKVFDTMPERNVFSWTAIISAYANHGQGEEAINLFQQMQQTGIVPDKVAFLVVLKACAGIAHLELGKHLHSQIIKSGFECDVILGSALVNMYGKCGCTQHALEVFNNMQERNVVSWNVMIAGYAQQGLGKEALAVYEQMKQENVEPDNVTYAVLLKACAGIAALKEGKQLHSDIVRIGLELDMIVGNTLIGMYAKCGCIHDAREVFVKMNERDVVSWNAMISGYGQQGLGKEALTLFEQMQREGLKPNEITYLSVLSACTHSGLVDEGRHFFDSMCKDHGVSPTMDHYACMVDLLSRSGCLADAEDFIYKMPIQPNAVIWRTLLGAARNHGHLEIGKRAFDYLVKLEPENDAAHVLLSNIYAAAGRRLR